MNEYNKRDYWGQKKVLPTLKQMFSGCTLTIDQHFNDKNEIDIYITATTKNNREVWYAIECKDRNYNHEYFKKNGFLIEQTKINALERAKENGYRPIYLNTFTDNICIIWNVANVNWDELKEYKGMLPIATVEDKGEKEKKNKLLTYELKTLITAMKN